MGDSIYVIVLFVASVVFMRWARVAADENGLVSTKRRRFVQRYVGMRVVAVIAGMSVSYVLTHLVSDTVELYGSLALVAVLLGWFVIHYLHFRRELHTTELPTLRRLLFDTPAREVSYHDYKLMIYGGGWRKPVGWIHPARFNTDLVSDRVFTSRHRYKRGTSLDAIEKDLKNKVNDHLNLK
jgi:hypothetical protein